MTGHCTLCTTIITAEKDNILDDNRGARMTLDYGRKVRQHMITHPNAVQIGKGIAEVFEAMVYFSFIETTEDDGNLAADMAKMRDELLKATEPKTLNITRAVPRPEPKGALPR